MKSTTWPGNWKVACHRCGFWYPSSEIKKEWTGLLVCGECWEPRHEQTLIQIRGEVAVPSFVSKDQTPDIFQGVCDITTNSGYADLGAADCAQADNTQFTYTFLKDVFKNGHGGM